MPDNRQISELLGHRVWTGTYRLRKHSGSHLLDCSSCRGPCSLALTAPAPWLPARIQSGFLELGIHRFRICRNHRWDQSRLGTRTIRIQRGFSGAACLSSNAYIQLLGRCGAIG